MRTVAGWVRSLVCKGRRVNAASWVRVVTKGNAATADLLGIAGLKATVVPRARPAQPVRKVIVDPSVRLALREPPVLKVNADPSVRPELREPLVLKVHAAPPDRLDQMVQQAPEGREEPPVREGRQARKDPPVPGAQRVRVAQRARKDPLGLQTGPLKPHVQVARRAFTMDCALKMAGEQARVQTLQRVTA